MNWSWLQLVAHLAPVIVSVIPGAAPLGPILATAIQTAEALPKASGAQKFAHAQQLVDAGVAATNTIAGRTVIDPTLAADVAASAIHTIVATANIVHMAHAPAAAGV